MKANQPRVQPHQVKPRLLMSQQRLTILTLLRKNGGSATFLATQAALGYASAGSLSVMAKGLEDVGFVRIKKEFVDRRPRTTLQLTEKGRNAIINHLAELSQMAAEPTMEATA